MLRAQGLDVGSYFQTELNHEAKGSLLRDKANHLLGDPHRRSRYPIRFTAKHNRTLLKDFFLLPTTDIINCARLLYRYRSPFLQPSELGFLQRH